MTATANLTDITRETPFASIFDAFLGSAKVAAMPCISGCPVSYPAVGYPRQQSWKWRAWRDVALDEVDRALLSPVIYRFFNCSGVFCVLYLYIERR